MKKTVKFTDPWKIYSKGDIAGFEPQQAEALIKAGVAEPYAKSDGKAAAAAK